MKIIQLKNSRQISKVASEMILEQIKNKSKSIIGYASGNSVKQLYKMLIHANKKRKIDFSKTKAFALDEYYPLKKSDKKGFNYFLKNYLFNKINIKKENIYLLNPETKNPKKECQNYEKLIKKYPIDIQILGIGVNGHIAFNEPNSKPNSKTRLINLSDSTSKTNKLKQNSLPNQALTMGIKTIMSAKTILLIASGKSKANAINSMIEKKINKKCPASFLRKHKNLIILLDNSAGKLI
jgi:glucosamine-6-phosphate deaminase